MKHLHRSFRVLGFIVEYILPIVIFGRTFPLTHSDIKPGLTKMGFLALGILVIIIGKKSKEKIGRIKKSTLRETLLSIFPMVTWAIIFFAGASVQMTITNLLQYWQKVVFFIAIGRILYIISTFMENEHE